MQHKEKFSLLRSILKGFGLSAEATDDIIDRITDFLSDRDESKQSKPEYPYFIRDDFLSKAEQSFYLVLKSVVADKTILCTKVSLGDLFYVKSSDSSKFRTYTNKIDRKHVDFLLCDPNTVRPIVGIELDDKSHQRNDRQARDEFVEGVFEAAHLPLVRVPVKQAYSTAELSALLASYLGKAQSIPSIVEVLEEKKDIGPRCPKCGGEMVLRTAKTGANQGGRFWGCKGYPNCRGILSYGETNPN
jgi:hypothetical protein